MKKVELGEQQRQIRALQAHLEKYAEDMFAERKLGTALRAFMASKPISQSFKKANCVTCRPSQNKMRRPKCLKQMAYFSLTKRGFLAALLVI